MEEIQTEYGLAYLLTAACVFLGLLLVCVPRPRKVSLDDKKGGKYKRRKPAK
jgi:hypothetical protein